MGRYAKTVECPECGKKVAPQGLKWHMKGHDKNPSANKPPFISATKTTNPSEATSFILTPKSMQCAFTPIMRAAFELTAREFGGNKETPLEDFFDSILYTFFRDRGYILAGYTKLKEGENNGN